MSASIPGVDLVASLPAFVLAVLLISASPGPAMALIFRRAALRGLRGGLLMILSSSRSASNTTEQAGSMIS